MVSNHTETSVVVIGGGVSGLTLATLLRKSGVACTVLERRDRAYVEVRQRAGVVEARAVVNNLLRELIDGMGGDVRFSVADVTIQNDGDGRPRVGYSDNRGSHAIVCDYIIGCDGDRGVSRASIPDGVLTSYSHEFGYAWLAALVEAPVTGDAAHLVRPTGAKGMNLALYDVDVLAGALLSAVRDRDRTALDRYSDTVLPHIWTYQDFSVWMTDTMHDAGDPALHGEFRQRMARARLDTLFDSPAAARLHTDYQRGVV